MNSEDFKPTQALKFIKSRRSIFPVQYGSGTILKKEIELLLEAAIHAPTHRLTQPWRFIVLKHKKKDELGEFLATSFSKISKEKQVQKEKKILEKVKVSDTIILLCLKRDGKESVPEWEEMAALSMAVQNMWLLCSTMGIGAYWSSPVMIRQISDFIPLAKDTTCKGIFYMGKIENPPAYESPRLPTKDVTQWYTEN